MANLVARDRESGWFMASVVPRKWVCQHSVFRMEIMLDLLGYKRIIMKTDQEPAILDLKSEIIRSRREEIIPEESPAMDSRGNSFIEQAIQAIQG